MCCSSRYFRANCLADWIASDACAIVFQLCQLWEQPFWNNKGNNRILPIRFHCAVCIYGACLKWLLPEFSFSDRWSRGTEIMGTRMGHDVIRPLNNFLGGQIGVHYGYIDSQVSNFCGLGDWNLCSVERNYLLGDKLTLSPMCPLTAKAFPAACRMYRKWMR